MSKTPQFDKALDEILKNLWPNRRSCKNCRGEFEIFQEDIEMYHKLRVPPPTLCPLCRMQRRMAFSLRLPPFYRKSCQAPGHSEKVISLFPESSPHIVYDNTYWRSDAWDAMDYGASHDPARPFFVEFRALFFCVPHQALFVDPQSVNSEYSIGGVAGKNCYYVSAPLYSEDVLYAFAPTHSRDSVDVNSIFDSELLYESVRCYRCSNCNFCVECVACRDSWFFYDCRNCTNCFLSANLRNKSYCFRNEQLSRDAYDAKIKQLGLGKRSVLRSFRVEFERVRREAIHKYADIQRAENSLGDRLSDCRNCFQVFDASENCENLRYVEYAIAARETMDVTGVVGEMIYESASLKASQVLFSANIRNSTFLEYSAYCLDCDYCFGCVGLRSKKFCIFNRQYDEETYWRMLDSIKTAMLARHEYGEFFPLKLGLVPYQNTYAAIHFPENKAALLGQGVPYYEALEYILPEGTIVIQPHEVADDLGAVGDGILGAAILCEATQKPFRIVDAELAFYRRKGLPIPVIHPDERMRSRFTLENRFRLWQYPCSECGTMMWTIYAPENKPRVYCESCYLREVV